MAKMSVRRASYTGRAHAIPLHAKVYKRGTEIEVCVMAGLGGGRKFVHACAAATNPRTALAKALAKASREVSKRRRGVFAGYRR